MTISVFSAQTAQEFRSTRPKALGETVVVVESSATVEIGTVVDPDVLPAMYAQAEPGGVDWSDLKAKYGL